MVMSMRKPIETELGIISGRDAIYLDEQRIATKPYGLIFKGDFNGNLCSNNTTGKEWIPYELSFDYPLYFVCYELDLYPYELPLPSSFNTVAESELIASLFKQDWTGNLAKTDLNHYVLATYDYVYEILAQDFKLSIL